MFRAFSAVLKIAIASLLTGAILSALNISAPELLNDLGLSSETILETMEKGVTWAVPHLVLGSIVVIPIWIIVYLFRPPRS